MHFSSLYQISAVSAVLLSATLSQAAPTNTFKLKSLTPTHNIEERVATSATTQTQPADPLSSSEVQTTGTNDAADQDVSTFEISDVSGGAQAETKRITVRTSLLLSKTTTEETAEDSNTNVAARAEAEDVQGSIVECGVDKAGRNYCRTSDAWYEYRCETGEVHYFRQVPYADEEVCADGSVA